MHAVLILIRGEVLRVVGCSRFHGVQRLGCPGALLILYHIELTFDLHQQHLFKQRFHISEPHDLVCSLTLCFSNGIVVRVLRIILLSDWLVVEFEDFHDAVHFFDVLLQFPEIHQP